MPVKPPSANGAKYDLGPAWFWPDMQPRMRRLVAQLGLPAFPQETEGAVLVERSRSGPPQRYERGFNTEPRSMRLAGGMQALVDEVAAPLPPGTIHRGVRVTSIRRDDLGLVHIDALGGSEAISVVANSVILALPPRVIAATIAFFPEFPPALHQALAAVPTWMAGHAKVVAVYDRAFWRDQGLSGTASSAIGPLMELHDASAPDGRPALFGFVGVAAASRQAIGSEKLIQMALAQLVRLYGPQAAQPVDVLVTDWAADPFTATAADQAPLGSHPEYGPPPSGIELWDGRLVFAGTEVATEFGGYLEGALEAATAAVTVVNARQPQS